jgi:hypothetical protein
VLLLQLADRYFGDPGFEDVLADCLRDQATLIELWETWSADQRWTPSVEDTKVGWYDGGRQHVRVHLTAAPLADFIHRPSQDVAGETGRGCAAAIWYGLNGFPVPPTFENAAMSQERKSASDVRRRVEWRLGRQTDHAGVTGR